MNAVFFGGGTPSLMDPEIVADVISAIRKLWPAANDLEITLEANPGSVEAGRFNGFNQAGINRISMGIQALNDADLKRLGRIHNTSEALTAFEIARTAFERVSFDLIYGRQNQSLPEWKLELKQALSLAIDHISLYQLTIEQGTAFGDRYNIGKLRGLPDDDLSADMYAATQELCDELGMSSYEVSNHARDGAQSRHNLIYWRYGDYLGIGPGAHGRLTLNGQRHATECFSNPQRWLDASHSGLTEKPRETLSLDDQASEFLMMGLRLKEGVNLQRYEALAGRRLSAKKITQMEDIGMIYCNDAHLQVTAKGFMVLNAILAELLSD